MLLDVGVTVAESIGQSGSGADGPMGKRGEGGRRDNGRPGCARALATPHGGFTPIPKRQLGLHTTRREREGPMSEPTKNTYEATTRMTDVNGFAIHTNEAGSGPALFGFHGGGPGANAWDN